MSLPKATIKRIMKEVDDMLISEDALNQVVVETTTFIKRLTEESLKNAKESKRKTIKPDDVSKAISTFEI